MFFGELEQFLSGTADLRRCIRFLLTRSFCSSDRSSFVPFCIHFKLPRFDTDNHPFFSPDRLGIGLYPASGLHQPGPLTGSGVCDTSSSWLGLCLANIFLLPSLAPFFLTLMSVPATFPPLSFLFACPQVISFT